jgi:hypothetical protein
MSPGRIQRWTKKVNKMEAWIRKRTGNKLIHLVKEYHKFSQFRGSGFPESCIKNQNIWLVALAQFQHIIVNGGRKKITFKKNIQVFKL